MPLPAASLEKIVVLIRTRYPGWTSFEDPSFNEDEVDYKRKAVKKVSELLDRSRLQELLQSSRFDDFLDRVKRAGQDNNLLFRGVPAKGDLGILYASDLDPQSFATALFDLFYGPNPTDRRLDQYLTYVAANNLPSKWTFPTYFLFLLYPDTELFIKPTPISRFLGLVGQAELWDPAPSGRAYTLIRDVALSLRQGMEEFRPRDMIDVQSAIWVAATADGGENGGSHYWKVAPGEGARFWQSWKEGGYIAIGWGEFGDLTGVSPKEFDRKLEELVKQHPDWKKAGVRQVGQFLTIAEGDRITANRGKDRVIGIGTVVGSYYFEQGQEYPHRIPVQWDDTAVRSVNEPAWSRTLLKLDAAKFHALEAAPIVDDSQGRPLAAFTPECFDLLDQLQRTPTLAFYTQRKTDFRQRVEGPLQDLMLLVAKRLPSPIQAAMETEKKIFARIPKNDYGKGGAWPFYWGAFYPKGGKRTEDAQLFLSISRDGVRLGFHMGEYGSEQRERFLHNLGRLQRGLRDTLRDRLPPDEYQFGIPEPESSTPRPAWDDWLRNPDEAGLEVSRTVARAEAVRLNSESFQQLLLDTYERLFPFVLLCLSDAPAADLESYLEESSDGGDLEPAYSLDDLATDTYHDKELLTAWLRALERKGQVILYGPPGTGKTYMAQRLARHLVAGTDGFVELVQFHPAYAYEDFIQGIRPQAISGQLDYPMVPGRFRVFCQRAARRRGVCILIIDEINRANLSRVLGELMYLLEYRDRVVPLAGGNQLSVPANVRIIGTMNTADRSIALVDHALRRRFAFIPLRPNYDALRAYHTDGAVRIEELIAVLEQLNKLIGDSNYEIGISFFLKEHLSRELESIWRMEIEPYLEEFFFDRQQKLTELRWSAIKARVLV